MLSHTEPNRQMTKPTKKGMKRVSPKIKKKVKKKKMKPMGKVKKTISY
tara:strand:+ start:206 stop:349 length:144 start_codon:yes stop_codon:yes gene_type:complete